MNKDSQIQLLQQMPLIPILRGIKPDMAKRLINYFFELGYTTIEVTQDSPNWQQTISFLAKEMGDDMLICAGTVLTPQGVIEANHAGAKAIFSPNKNEQVINTSKSLGMLSVPGCFTPSDCFDALTLGADILKIFPANSLDSNHIRSLTSVLPKGAKICATGGIDEANYSEYLAAGSFAVGIGSSLYKPGKELELIKSSARKLVNSYQSSEDLT